MKFLFQVGIATNHPVEGFVFPNLAVRFLQLVDFIRSEGLDRMQQFLERPEDRFAFLILFFDLGLEKPVHVLRHDTSRVEWVMALFMAEEKTLQRDFPSCRRKLTELTRA